MSDKDNKPQVTSEDFGTLEGQTISQFTLKNSNGLILKAIDYGCIVTHLMVPDRDGTLGDIVLGHDTLDGYLSYSPFFGAAIGRYANRIGGATFTLEGHTYTLPMNNGPNTLHGGDHGFHAQVWQAEGFVEDDAAGIRFARRSPDGEEGFPGTLSVVIEYRLTDADEFRIDYYAKTDKATPVAMTQHSYFNLTADPQADVLAHLLQLKAARYTPVDETLIPTGEQAPVAGTPFDFTSARSVGTDIDADDTQLARGAGYDHNFVLDRQGDGMVHAATVFDPASGRRMDVETTEPGIQFYSGNFLEADKAGKGRNFAPRSGLCLETQAFPNSPNQPDFPPAILWPGEAWRSTTTYRFTSE